MLNVSLMSWQNTGTHPIVRVSEPSITETVQNCPETQIAEPELKTPSGNAFDEVDCRWMSRLAAEWQVGIETLVPDSATYATSNNSFSEKLDTISDTIDTLPPVQREVALKLCSNDNGMPEERSNAPATYLAAKLIEAVQHGTASTVEQVLRLINRQSQSTVAVLLVLKETFAKSENSPLSIDWETGWDANANSFTRISFTLLNDWSKGSGATKLIIGSDGTTYATFSERWNATPIYLSPNDALAKVKGSNLKRRRDFNKAPQATSLSTTQLRCLKAPRHFTASGF